MMISGGVGRRGGGISPVYNPNIRCLTALWSQNAPGPNEAALWLSACTAVAQSHLLHPVEFSEQSCVKANLWHNSSHNLPLGAFSLARTLHRDLPPRLLLSFLWRLKLKGLSRRRAENRGRTDSVSAVNVAAGCVSYWAVLLDWPRTHHGLAENAPRPVPHPPF